MKIETKPWDAAEHLDRPEMIIAYLEAAFEDGDPALIMAAIGDVARAKGMGQIARDTGLSRGKLDEIRAGQHTEFATVLKVLKELGLRVAVEPLDSKENNRAA